jgi:hypothetical protein
MERYVLAALIEQREIGAARLAALHPEAGSRPWRSLQSSLGRALRKLEGEGYIYRIDYKPGDKGWRDHGGVGFSVIEDRMATAYHEAGHAVIARTLGIPVKLATIKPGEGYAGRVLTKVSNYETQTRALWMREALMSFAGAIAEGEMGGIGSKDAWRTTRGEGGDLTSVRHAVHKFIGEPLKDGRVLIYKPDYRAMRPKLKRQAQQLVRKHWPAIERVAKALIEHETLSGTEVDKIIAA